MTDPTNPTSTGNPFGPIAGIRDYDARLLLHRADGNTPIRANVAFRFPASSTSAALAIARRIGADIDQHNGDAGTPPWRVLLDETTVVEVPDTESSAEIAAERDHWKRVVAALAAKLPAVLELTADEYSAADPDDLQAVPTGRGMMFMTGQVMAAAGAAPGSGMQTPGTEPKLIPYDGDVPANPGGHTDPDVRTVAVPILARAKPDEVEILTSGRWVRLTSATIDQQQRTVALEVGGGSYTAAHHRLLIARPATIEGYGVDLPGAASAGRQALTDSGWMTVQSAVRKRGMAGTYEVVLVNDTEQLTMTADAGKPVLLRAPRPGWWS